MLNAYPEVWDDHPEYTMLRDGLEYLEQELTKPEPDRFELDVGLDMLAVSAVAFDLSARFPGHPVNIWGAREQWEEQCVWPDAMCPRCGEAHYDNLGFSLAADAEFVVCDTCRWPYMPGAKMYSRQFMEYALGTRLRVSALEPGWALLTWWCGCEAVVTPAGMGAHWVCEVHRGDVLDRVARGWMLSQGQCDDADQLVRAFEARFGPQKYASWLLGLAREVVGD